MTKELQISFIGVGEVRGFQFTQIQSSPRAYLYEVKVPDKETGLIISTHYEVFLRKRNVQARLNIDSISYPKSNSFGAWAFTYSNKDLAIGKFKELSNHEPKHKKAS